jgi:DNA-binding transcriptional MerR regulator
MRTTQRCTSLRGVRRSNAERHAVLARFDPESLESPVGGDRRLEVVEENRSYSIGDLSRRSGLSVRTIRFYSDVGVVPASARSASGYRLYDVEAVARLDLVRTLRDLGLPLESIRALLNAQTSLPEVAAAHLKVLDHQIQTLRLRRAVLRAAAKTNTTPEEVALMHRLAKMFEVERQHLIDDFLDEVLATPTPIPSSSRCCGR